MLLISMDFYQFSMAPQHGQFSTRIPSLVLAIVWCILNSVSRIHGSIRNQPQNRIVTVGEDVTFVCSSDITYRTITWIYKPPYKLMSSLTFPLTISNGTQTRNPFGDKVEVQNYTEDGGSSNPVVFYNLTVKNVQFGDAGLYTCQDNNGYGQPVRGALLAVVDGPTCTSSNRNVTKSSDNFTVDCTVSYCGNFSFSVNWDNITVIKPQFPMSMVPPRQPRYQSNSSSLSSRTETIVNGFTTTIYTQTYTATVSETTLDYNFNFVVTPGQPQILSDTIDGSVPSFNNSVYLNRVIISLPVNETGCSFYINNITPLNGSLTVNDFIGIRTSNYPPPSYQWVVCYDDPNNCTNSTKNTLNVNAIGVISSLEVLVSNTIEGMLYRCTNITYNVRVTGDTKADVHVQSSEAESQTGSAKLASIVVPVVLLLAVIIAILLFCYLCPKRCPEWCPEWCPKRCPEWCPKRCPIFPKMFPKGGTCFNRNSCDLPSQQGQTNFGSTCDPEKEGKNCSKGSDPKVEDRNGKDNAYYNSTCTIEPK